MIDLIAIAGFVVAMIAMFVFADMCAIADAQRKHTYEGHSRDRGLGGPSPLEVGERKP